MKPRKAVYQINLRIKEEDNQRLKNIKAESELTQIDVFRLGLTEAEKKIKKMLDK